METCRPLKSTETVGANGLVNVEINNTNSGAGPFTLKVVNTDTNEVIINNKSIAKSGATGSTIVKVEPDAGKSLGANTNYTLTLTDGSCTVTKTERKEYTYRPNTLYLRFSPRCGGIGACPNPTTYQMYVVTSIVPI